MSRVSQLLLITVTQEYKNHGGDWRGVACLGSTCAWHSLTLASFNAATYFLLDIPVSVAGFLQASSESMDLRKKRLLLPAICFG